MTGSGHAKPVLNEVKDQVKLGLWTCRDLSFHHNLWVARCHASWSAFLERPRGSSDRSSNFTGLKNQHRRNVDTFDDSWSQLTSPAFPHAPPTPPTEATRPKHRSVTPPAPSTGEELPSHFSLEGPHLFWRAGSPEAAARSTCRNGGGNTERWRSASPENELAGRWC